jgi:hypothetical protein
MKIRTPFRIARVPFAILPALLLLVGCGGRSDSLIIGSGDDGGADSPSSCSEFTSCPAGAPWDPSLCACVVQDDAGNPVMVEDEGTCPAIDCAPGTFFEAVGGMCLCAPYPDYDAGDYDVWAPDAPSAADSPYYQDVTAYPPDVYELDSPISYYDQYVYDAGCPYYYYCPPGYVIGGQFCNCVACDEVCPPGQEPNASCNGCEACATNTLCPTGFTQGYNCGCVPDGVDAGPPPQEAGIDGGTGCTLEGYTDCALGTWCQLGTCPDNATQYGCYCDSSGQATCNLNCPAPPSCSIPGLGTCPANQTCVYGQCDGDSGSLLACSCGYGGSAYCDTLPCGTTTYFYDGGPTTNPDAGPSCYLEGYTQCPVGQYCKLGTCPGGTAYGCTCNADGTTDCNLQCPPPGPCTIPGEGTCPYGQTCTFGSCSASSGSVLSCYCDDFNGGGATCYTRSCANGFEAGED